MILLILLVVVLISFFTITFITIWNRNLNFIIIAFYLLLWRSSTFGRDIWFSRLVKLWIFSIRTKSSLLLLRFKRNIIFSRCYRLFHVFFGWRSLSQFFLKSFILLCFLKHCLLDFLFILLFIIQFSLLSLSHLLFFLNSLFLLSF